MDKLEFFINEKKVSTRTAEARVEWNLASFLRNVLNLTGTKVSCGVGGCGSCTVLLSRYCPEEKRVKHNSVNACLTPLYSMHGAHILTVEGLSDSNSYHEIQEAMALGNATQCGYCSPGFVMSVFGLQAETKAESGACLSKLKTALQGNLCRCTGYRPILEAFYKRSLCKTSCQKASEGCCKGDSGDIEDVGNIGSSTSSICIENLRKVERTNDDDGVLQRIERLLMSQVSQANDEKAIPLQKFSTSNQSSWAIPNSVAELYAIIENNKDKICKLVSGGTSDEFWKIVTEKPPDLVIDVSKVKEMRCVNVQNNILRLGASLTITEMQNELKAKIGEFPDSKVKILMVLLKMSEVYGSEQIRRSATIGGSLMVSSTASDLQTAFKGFGLSANFLNGKNDNGMTSQKMQGELEFGGIKILESIDVPLNDMIEHAWYEKIRRRKDFDLALMNLAVTVTRIGKEELEIILCFGGTLISRFVHKERLQTAGEFTVTEEMLERVVEKSLQNVGPTQLNLDRSTESLVETTTRSLLRKLKLYTERSDSKATSTGKRCADNFRATRILTKVDPNQADHNLVHREVAHASAIRHVTGEAKYCDDMPKLSNELEMAFVLSSKPHAKILNMDFSEALKLEGVIGKVSHEDVIKGRNQYGLVEKDEEIFASEKVTCYGQIIAGIVANHRDIALSAAKLVKVEYEELEPVIFTEEEAIKNNSFYKAYDIKLAKGDCDAIFDEGTSNVLRGEVKIGSQEHFYMEPQSCIVIPNGEDHEFEIISSTQNPTGVQMAVADVLNIPANSIVVKVKRVGGGFGGKESRCMMIALPTAIAANKFGRPVRCVLTRETDMTITGKRATYLTRHKVAFDNDGKLLALKMTVYIGAGHSIDVSMAEIERVILNLDNAYNIPNLEFNGYICKTNYPSNTVFRGTGGPQAAFLIENIVDMIAAYLKKEPSLVRSLQIYTENDYSPYGQSMKTSTVLKCWNECIKSSNYIEKKRQVEIFNSENSFVKRGISINPINYGVGYTVLHLNQGAALVHIYTDGTVLISHAGVEIGNGIHTKMIQIATSVLGVSGDKVKIRETATDKVPNSTPSSASMTSDLQGGAVMDACKKLEERLKPYKLKYSDSSWEEVITKAYMDRVSLSATGFYKVPEMGWDAASVYGNPFSYFSSGAACSLVELDCLTGQFQILSTDIIMDVGKSLNPSIDVGQIEGAFMQGVGLFLLEELLYDDSGRLCTAGPVTYKIPTCNDTPLEFNVSFLMGEGNPKAIYSSKAIGEPPLLLATSAFFAVKDAIRAYRKGNGKDTNFRLDSPATVEKILLACHTLFD